MEKNSQKIIGKKQLEEVTKMKKIETCSIEYCGYKNPKTPEELDFEILGLKTAIYELKKRIATLEQSKKLVEMSIKENYDNYNS